MEKLLIKGKTRLRGSLQISGAKNAVLPILAASLLTDKQLAFHNLPNLHDVTTTLDLLGCIGSHITVKHDGNMGIHVTNNQITKLQAPKELVNAMRASILVLGPLVGRYGKCEITMPGGCAIGERPINQHLEGLRVLGAKVEENGDVIIASTNKRLHGGTYRFPTVSVTSTENLVMAAVLADGKTVLENCACEPEIVDLVKCLRMMGANISGEGSQRIEIEGVEQLHGGEYTIMPDRIETGTYLSAVAITGGEVTLHNTRSDSLTDVINKLIEAGCEISCFPDSIHIKADYDRPLPVSLETNPFPGFPTDMQAQLTALNSYARGSAVIQENVFDGRFKHVYELKKMGADIRLEGNCAYITGKERLYGTEVVATDLRASASLVLAGLGAEGTTTVSSVHHIDRGYECIEEKLLRVGAEIIRKPA